MTGYLPLDKVPNITHTSSQALVVLSDKEYHTPAPIDLLLGSDVLGQVLDGTKVSIDPGRPIAFGTIFDFTLIEPIRDVQSAPFHQVNTAYTDIRMMFGNILMHPDHRQFQLILWRASPDQPLLTYSLNTVTYGLRSSPYHAIRILLRESS